MYNEFARIYDFLVFDIEYEKYANLIKENVSFKNDMNILEIGIGTGNMAKYFIEGSKDYIGIDPSSEMLEIASNKLLSYDNLKLLNIGIEDLSFQNEFDFSFTTLDTINYLEDVEMLKQGFKNVYDCLKDGAYFSFDINSENKIVKVLGDNSYIYEYENIFYTWQNEYDPDLKRVYMTLDFFIEEDGLYERITEEQVQNYYSLDLISNVLSEIGFKNTKILDLDTGEEVSKVSQRILVTTRK